MKPIRLLAILEATTITGPAKNLLQFAQCAREGDRAGGNGHRRFPAGPDRTWRRDGQAAGIPVYAVAEAGRFDRTVMAGLRAAARRMEAGGDSEPRGEIALPGARVGLRRMAPWVAFHHGYTWPDLRARIYNQLDRWSLRAAGPRADGERAVSPGIGPPRRGAGSHRGGAQRDRSAMGADAARPEAAAALRARLGIGPEKRSS